MATLAVLRDQSADPIAHAQARPVIGTQQFMLHNLENTVAFPVFLERNNGRIQRFIMMKAMIANTGTNQPQRALQDVWLLIPGNPRVSKNPNTGEIYYGDQSEGMIFTHLRQLVGGKGLFNSMTAMVTMRNMPITPNRKYGAAPNHFIQKNMVELGKQHISLCGGKRKVGDVEEVVEPMLPTSEEFGKFLQDGLAQTEKFFESLRQQKIFEPNLVFEVLPGTISMGVMPFYKSAMGDQLMGIANSGIRRFNAISNWNGATKINTIAQKAETGNGQQLVLGVRETGGRYSFDRLCTIYDRRLNQCEGRISLIDPVTIKYLEGSQQHDAEGEEQGVDTNIPVNNRKSRAKTLEEVAKDVGFIQFLNAELKVYANGKTPESMAVTFELALHENSTYIGIKDTSKLGNVAQVGTTDSEEAQILMDSFNEADLESILNATTGLTVVETEAATATTDTEQPAHAGGVGTELSDELPF